MDASMIPDYASADRVFPRFVAGVAIVGTLVLLVQMMLSPEAHPLFADREAGGQEDERARPLGNAGMVCRAA